MPQETPAPANGPIAYPALTRADVERHLTRVVDEMTTLAGVPGSQRALALGEQILDVCRYRLRLIGNGYDITGHPPPSLLR